MLASATPAGAGRSDQADLGAYVRARAADSLGAADQAVQDYGMALDSSQGNQTVAANALRQALNAGDRALAVRSARALEASGAMTPEARFVILGDAVRNGDWKEASRETDAVSKDEIFSFMAPLLRAWIAVGSKQGDPAALLAAGAADPLAGSYIAEHRPLILLAQGKEKEGLIEIRNRVESHDTRTQRLLVSTAAYLVRKGKRKQAVELLDGSGARLVGARKWLDAHKELPGEIRTPTDGLAEFFLRISIDLQRQEVLPMALSFARLSTFLAPEQAEAWLVTSSLLSAQSQDRQALAVLDRVSTRDPVADLVNDVRIELLTNIGDREEALKEAQKAVLAKNANVSDWTRLGDLYGRLEKYDEAAKAYAKALDLNPREENPHPEWTLWLLLGGALEQAGQWKEAKEALEQAYKLAPTEPLVLNYLGYAQLERRENLPEAEKLIAEASRLQPDSAQITDSLGWAHYLRGDYDSAIPLLERAVQDEPTDSEINEHLGDAYYSAGRRFEARYAWSAALVTAEAGNAARIRAKLTSGLTPDLISP
jgi:tetratricopeptide (TPR) repeat protein